MLKFEDEYVAIVTGGARGLGFAIAEELAKSGAKLALIDIDTEALITATQKLSSAGYSVSHYQCDVSNSAEVSETIDEIVETYGQIHILINNAAIAPSCSLLDCTEDQWDRVMQVNLKGYFLMAKTVVTHMVKEQIPGRIVNLSSTLGIHPKADLLAYTTTKGAIINLTYSLAAELGQYGIRVNAIAPGMIDTPMTQKSFANPMVKKIILGGIPLNRLGTPTEIGKVAVFLCSDYASFVNGELLIVDGGQTNGVPSRSGKPPGNKSNGNGTVPKHSKHHEQSHS